MIWLVEVSPIQSPAKYFYKVLLFSKQFPMEPSHMVVSNSGAVSLGEAGSF